MRRLFFGGFIALGLAAASVATWLYVYAGQYGVNVILRRGGSLWTASSPTDPRISASMRFALSGQLLKATSGPLKWNILRPGFQVSELQVLVGSREVDRIVLARVDPSRFRFEVKNRPAGDLDLQGWMKLLGAALVINGSYFSTHGIADTPILSDGQLAGPSTYDGNHGVFVAAEGSAEVRDLTNISWKNAFKGAVNGMVSYPMLIGSDGRSRTTPSNWLANRSFVAQDTEGFIVLGTTTDAFFSIDRLASFLNESSLQLKTALNLDGGPVACQGILLDGFVRDQCGSYELKKVGERYELLRPVFGDRRWGLPMILAVYPR